MIYQYLLDTNIIIKFPLMTATLLPTLPLTMPPLENGDRLPRAEFERRYQAMPQVKKAELIDGIVYMASPLRAKSHGEPHACIIGWLALYKAATPGIGLYDNATVRLDAENEPQPDALLRIESGGQSQLSDDDYIEGAPELIVEIAASSVSIDLGEKRDAYCRNGVQEYLVWRVYDRAIDWFRLKDGTYVQLAADDAGILRSEIFPGLWLDCPALLSGDLAQVLAVLQQGLATRAHQALVQTLSTLGTETD